MDTLAPVPVEVTTHSCPGMVACVLVNGNVVTKWSGTLGTTRAGRPITAHYFQGTGAGRALVIGGVHGSEQSAVEVAQNLVAELKKGPSPAYSVLIVPVLFPDSYALARTQRLQPGGVGGPQDSNRGRYVRGLDPNRNFPAPGQLTPHDRLGRSLLPENVLLMDLITRFAPTRIASLHAHRLPQGPLKRGQATAGIYAAPQTWAKDTPADQQQLYRTQTQQDDTLALTMARHAQARGARVPGNWLTSRPITRYPMGRIQGGTSLGQWGPRAIPGQRAGLTVITVEAASYYPSDQAQKPALRERELAALSSALYQVFLTEKPLPGSYKETNK
ncbi:M14 family zinc carboxypeptidase [Candidatus Cyanaurora vandensis]|uniref:M14 family zinc carboxypeptidase n=1 Tax=Candidatus Cyanaurora vandensis TaxID=2714958 RepID=UPI00257E6324|nr:M14 family zinc carboxypeptidase [Candidatus Cyanaurora vandensis]